MMHLKAGHFVMKARPLRRCIFAQLLTQSERNIFGSLATRDHRYPGLGVNEVLWWLSSHPQSTHRYQNCLVSAFGWLADCRQALGKCLV